MKHGDKAKAKTEKAKAGKKSSPEKSGKGKVASKAESGAAKESRKEASEVSKASSKESKAVVKKTGPAEKSGGNGKTKAGAKASGKAAGGISPTGDVTFNNPVVGASFKRASKKYFTAFRKLTDVG